MPHTAQGAEEPFIEVGYADKIVFTPQLGSKMRPDLRATWQQSQGLWRDHPVFRGMLVRDVIVWLRGEDSDI
jgi:hypothetical protein